MRTVSSSVMVALVIAALFWGNCFSCPQALQRLGAPQQPSHGCCHKTRQPAGPCQTQVLRHFVKADVGVQAPALPMVAVVSPSAPLWTPAGPTAPRPVEHDPPDLLPLHSSFRI